MGTYKLTSYNLQGNQKKIDELLLIMPESFYKNYIIGVSYLNGSDKIIDYNKAEKYLLKASEESCFSPTFYSLGYIYLKNGDINKAKEWFEKAISLNDSLAAYQMAIIYKKEFNFSKALDYLYFSERNDFIPATVELAVIFYDGNIIQKNLEKSFYYFNKAALKNNSLSQNNLGWMYEHGEGVEKNENQALYWYSLAANNGYVLGLENLNRLKLKDNLDFH